MLQWIRASFFCLLLGQAVSDKKEGALLNKKLWSLGPFASGKTEYDGDPLIPLGGVLDQFREGPSSGTAQRTWRTYLAEHAQGGHIAWRSVQVKKDSEANSHVDLPHDHIPFQQHMQSPPLAGGSDILHVQYWIVWTLKVRTVGRYSVDCKGLHTFEIVADDTNSSSGPIAGNIYSNSPNIYASPVSFEQEGKYHLISRVRGKVPLHFSCKMQQLDTSAIVVNAEVQKKNLPDIVLGTLIGGPSPIDIRVRNAGASWLRVHASVKPNAKPNVHGKAETLQLAPGMATLLPVLVDVQAPAVEKDSAACVRFTVRVVAEDSVGASREEEVPVNLRCRMSTQSALMSFVDVDGSIGVAALIRPRLPSSGDVALPIVVSLSGVGVEPQGQADAYKMKHRPGDPNDYIFGFEKLWVLAPQRGGPHNWEDVGMRTALRAIEALANAPITPKADSNRLVVHGHSRGGHGAWGLATRIPDRVRGVSSACGWYSREEYGDANNLWMHETSLMHLDKVLLGLLHASIAENENSLFASNLRGMPALVRVGSRDRAVQPWFGRRMARHLREEGVNVTMQEFDQEHWWWDTKQANDGGVMHDQDMRSWTEKAAALEMPTLNEIVAERDLVVAAAGPEYTGRFGLRILQRRSPASRAFLRVRASPIGFTVKTANVQRFTVEANSIAATAFTNGVVVVDGTHIPVDPSKSTEFCKTGGWSLNTADDGSCAADASDGTCSRGRYSTTWSICTHPLGPASSHRTLAMQGPIRKVFAAPWVVVVPDDALPMEISLATYFATGHLVAVDTSSQVLTVSQATSVRSKYRFVWLGRADRFPAAAASNWPVRIVSDGGTQVGATKLAVGPCLVGEGHGAAFLAPGDASDGSSILDLVVTATDMKALADLISFSFATNQPHTRAPMSNMLPDFMISGPDFRWKGYGGIVAAGYWDEEWRVAPDSAYFQC